jgi:hypothetical protein
VTRTIGEGGEQERKLALGFRESAAKIRMQWSEAASVLDRLAKTYQHQAECEDAEAAADKHKYGMSS